MPTPIDDNFRALFNSVWDTVNESTHANNELQAFMGKTTAQTISADNPYISKVYQEDVISIQTPLFDALRDAQLISASAVPNFIP